MICDARRPLYLRFSAAMATYAIATFATGLMIGMGLVRGAPAVVVALLPMIPAAYAASVWIALFRTFDELLRKILTEALALSWLGIGFLAISYDLVRNTVHLPSISGWEVWVAQNVLFVGALVAGLRRYR